MVSTDGKYVDVFEALQEGYFGKLPKDSFGQVLQSSLFDKEADIDGSGKLIFIIPIEAEETKTVHGTIEIEASNWVEAKKQLGEMTSYELADKVENFDDYWGDSSINYAYHDLSGIHSFEDANGYETIFDPKEEEAKILGTKKVKKFKKDLNQKQICNDLNVEAGTEIELPTMIETSKKD